jgi:phosphatidate phosphatase APP1
MRQFPRDAPGIDVIFDQLMKSTQNEFLRMLHLAAASGEDMVDRIRRKVSRKLGSKRPRRIVAYRGHSGAGVIHVSGRVLSNSPHGGPLDHDGWWENLINTWLQWESDEVAGAPVTVRFQDLEQTVTTDEEGYYRADFTTVPPVGGGLLWHTATARAGSPGHEIHAVHEIMVPPPGAGFGIISDLDDTVIHTGVTSLLLAAKLTFLENAKTRKPLDGVATLYQSLQHGGGTIPLNPIFYISSSPWNLHDLLVDFLRLNEIPPGPLLLQDLGLDRTKFIKQKGHGHKSEMALALMDIYQHLPFVLIGDSGQEDPQLYAEMTRLRPGRILAIYIRDVDPDADSPRDRAIQRSVDIAAAAGVPMILARNSLSISEHARQIGLISDSAISEIVAEVAADQCRPETGEQALKDALQSALPTDP